MNQKHLNKTHNGKEHKTLRIILAENRRLQRNFRPLPHRSPFGRSCGNAVDAVCIDGQTEAETESLREREAERKENRES